MPKIPDYTTTCPKCGNKHSLYWHSSKRAECEACGRIFRAEAGQIKKEIMNRNHEDSADAPYDSHNEAREHTHSG